MDLINAAHTESDAVKRESLFAMSRILVDAVTQSREAQCAAESSKVSMMTAEKAVLEVNSKLRECMDLVKEWRRSGVVYSGIFN